MYLKIIDSTRIVVALADKDLVGQKFFEGKKQLDVKESFYKGEEMPVEKLKETLHKLKEEDATFNIVGEKSIELAIREGLIEKENVLTIDKIPYSFIFL
jgi:hypothetical protein